MKILIAAEIFPPDIGGPATYTVRIGEEFTKRGHQVEVVCYSDKEEQDSYSFKVHRIIRSKTKLLHYYKYKKQLKKLAKDFDVIYAMGPVGSGSLAMQVAKKFNKKLVVKVVGDYAWEQARNLNQTNKLLDEFQQEKHSGKIGLLQKIERQVCQNANQVIVPSNYLKNIVQGWGAEPEKIKVIYNSKEPSQVANVEKVPGKIISVGRLVPWKGFKTLISLMPSLLENDEFSLLIAGDGPDKEKLNELISKSNLQSKIQIRYISHDKLLEEIASSEMFVLNSGYEGLSHVILEAMSVGTPVIASDIGGNKELIKHGSNGFLVEYENRNQLLDEVIRLHSDENLRNEFVSNSKKLLTQFDFNKMIEETLTTLQS